MSEGNGQHTPTQTSWANLGLELDSRDRPLIHIDNVVHIIERDPALTGIVWYDEFHNRIFTCLSKDLNDSTGVREWADVDSLRIAMYMQGVLKLHKMTDEMVQKGVVVYASLNRRNEPKEWMESLKWDGSPRVDKFLTDALGAPHSMYTRAVSKNFWIGMVARIYIPGCQLDNMVVLEGPQGIGKTRALRAIGGRWYAEASSSVQDKDFYLALQGKLLIEIGELESFSKADVTKIKGAITCLNDRFRTPYDRSSQDHPRQCVFAGTTNENQWIKDQTGARRFWPIRCDLIDVEYIHKHRDQLFAEAVARFKEKETWYEMPESTTKEQDDRRLADAWEEIVSPWLADHLEGVSLAQVADECVGIKMESFNMQDQKRLAQCMRRVGWERRHTPMGNLWYKLKKVNAEPSEPSSNS